jgi:hypothetical protein
MSVKKISDREKSYRVLALASIIQGRFDNAGPIQADAIPTPGGTADYEGRAVAFSITNTDNRVYRVVVEEVTLDEEEETGRVRLIGDDVWMPVSVGDVVVFDPTGRDLAYCMAVGVVTEFDPEATGDDWTPLVRINSGDHQEGEIVAVRRVKAVLTT